MESFFHHKLTLTLSDSHRSVDEDSDLRACLFGNVPWSPVNSGTPCYALLEAARFFGLPETLETSGLPYQCLFSGASEDELAEVAPYLVQLSPDAGLTKNLLAGTSEDAPPWQMWPRRGAVFMRSTRSLEELVTHFRRFTRLRNDTTERWNYFRFYAPEVMLTIISKMQPDQYDRFGAGIDFFAVPDGEDRLAILGAKAPLPC